MGGVRHLANPNRSFFTSLNHLQGKAKTKGDSFNQFGIRLGWNETWKNMNGISTRLSVGVNNRKYLGEQDFFAIKRKNIEYNVNFSLWKRDFTIWGLTPRLHWQYKAIDSNSPFEEYSKNDVNLLLTKTF